MYARKFGFASLFGGYLDIIFDFIVYLMIPIALAFNDSAFSYRNTLALSAMLSSFCLNTVSLFYLSALLEKFNFKNEEVNKAYH